MVGNFEIGRTETSNPKFRNRKLDESNSKFRLSDLRFAFVQFRDVMAVLFIVLSSACVPFAIKDPVRKLGPTPDDLKSIHQPTPDQRALGIYQPYSDADIDFMTGM